MKTRTLIAGVAALFLATGTANGEDDVWKDLGRAMFDCKDVLVEHVHLSDQEVYRIEIAVDHKSRKRPPIVTFDAKNLTLTVNGKRCKEEKTNEAIRTNLDCCCVAARP